MPVGIAKAAAPITISTLTVTSHDEFVIRETIVQLGNTDCLETQLIESDGV